MPDVATPELVREFYRRIWKLKEPKGKALWAAKKMLRDKKDLVTGKPVYDLRDWAGWVMTGEVE